MTLRKIDTDVTKKIENMQKKADDVTMEVEKMNNDVKTNTQTNALLNSTMSSALHKLNHVETGSLKCTTSTSWRRDAKYVTVEFTRQYTSPPVVFTSVKWWIAKTNKDLVMIGTSVTVNTTHLTVACHKSSYDGEISAMEVNWISLPSDV